MLASAHRRAIGDGTIDTTSRKVQGMYVTVSLTPNVLVKVIKVDGMTGRVGDESQRAIVKATVELVVVMTQAEPDPRERTAGGEDRVPSACVPRPGRTASISITLGDDTADATDNMPETPEQDVLQSVSINGRSNH